MNKLNNYLLFVIIIFINSSIFSQENNQVPLNEFKNHFRIGINYTLNGTGDEISAMYQNEYQRKLNKYLEIGLGIGFSSYMKDVPVNNVPTYNSTSIISTDLVVNLLVVDFDYIFFKVGAGYSLRHVKRIKWETLEYITDSNGQNIPVVTYNRIKGFDKGVIAQMELGFRFATHFATSLSGRYYGEGQYISLALAGINFYYSF